MLNCFGFGVMQRSVRDVAELYGCEKSLRGVEAHRASSGLHSISSKCFGEARISALLIDDGIVLDKMLDLQSHRSFVPVVRRIVRIERLAETILDNPYSDFFLNVSATIAGEAVALKSVAAYRSGLEINPFVEKKDAEEGLSEVLSCEKPIRIQNKSLIDYIFLCSLDIALCIDLPIQIHTGFGDSDLDLRLSNPLHLRAVLEDKRYSKCRIVLLHASYPFSKEASYLASVYSQVYLDFGLAVPKLSVHGMISSVKELLELAPIKKVMFSTDGYAFPETFYLGAKRAREVALSVLCNACDDGDLTIAEAIEAAEDIFKQNAVQFYKLEGDISNSGSIVPCSIAREDSSASPNGIVFVRILWVDTSGQRRCRAVPAKRFHEVVKQNGIGLTFASMGMTSSSDGPAYGTDLTGVGEIRLIPDLSTKWKIPWAPKEEMVLADMHLKPGETWEYCPRETLRRISKVLRDEFNLIDECREGKDDWVPFDSTPYCSTSGFDAASHLLQEVMSALQSIKISIEQVHAESGNGQFEIAMGHTICNHAADNLILAREVIRAVARKHGLLATFVPKYSLDDIGSGSHVHISLLQNGKNIFMASEETSRHGMSKVGEEFMAGVFTHLPSIMAFTAPLPNSYDRIQPNTWSGAYLCWGKENREAPLRTSCPPGISEGLVSNFEIKAFDGCANPHLGLAAILAAGIDGLRRHLTLPEPVVTKSGTNPSSLDGKIQRLPKELSDSVDALEKDAILKDFIGEKLVTAVIGVRKISKIANLLNPVLHHEWEVLSRQQ
ncbi:hypothetical protein Syun_000700 [Stephania yunnanensis]|uniref:GS catalytic domain-containing protein n=1 Tax=Stephania yunnanensis TaxID=152371 RepID=A0AAP0LDH3_9MAGN